MVLKIEENNEVLCTSSECGIEKIKGIHLNSITYGLNRIVWIIILEMILNIKVIYPIL